MIFDHISNIGNYKGLKPNVVRAMEMIRDADFEKLENKTYLVDGFDFRFFILSYETRAVNDRPEAHRNFIDIQYIISGKENIGVGQLKDMTEEVEANPEKDIWFYKGPMDYITLTSGMFAVFFPNDAHAPDISPNEGTNTVRKCVFKVRV